MARVKFPKGKQRLFSNSASVYFKNDWKKVAKFLCINGRTLRDWRCERYTMNYTSLKKLHAMTKIPMPLRVRILEDYWSAKKYASAGALKRFQMYGSPATPEGRRKGGLETQRLIRMNPEMALQTGIIVRKIIYDPRYSLELAEFIGIMLGDGGVTNYQLNITLNSQTDKEYLPYVKNLIEKLFWIKVSLLFRKTDIAVRIVASGRNLVELVQKYGLKVGNKVRQAVDIPSWILHKDEYAIACLRGLMDTDGSCYVCGHKINDKRYYNLALCFTNASRALLKSVYAILNKNGYYPCMTGRRVYIYRQDQVVKYFHKIGSHNPKHWRKYKDYVEELRGNKTQNPTKPKNPRRCW